MQSEIVATITNFLPVIKACPEVLTKLAPTLRKIIKAVVAGKTPSDKEYASWGKALLQEAGDHLRKIVEAEKKSPINELYKKYKDLNLKEKASKQLTGSDLENVL